MPKHLDSSSPTRSPSPRNNTLVIPLRRRAVDNPTELQLVHWARKHNFLQRLLPGEASLDHTEVPERIKKKLRVLYAESLEKWKAKEAAELAARPPTKPLSELLSDALQNTLPSS